MLQDKIIRSICYFSKSPSEEIISKVNEMTDVFVRNNYIVQTKRICSFDVEKIKILDSKYGKDFTFSLGKLSKEVLISQFDYYFNNINTHFNIDLTDKNIDGEDVQTLFNLIKKRPDKTFNFTYVFNNSLSTPFFPSASYEKDGFSIGLQPTDLSYSAKSLDEWFKKMKNIWHEIMEIVKDEKLFLGIDSSIAPMLSKEGSFIGFIKRLGMSFSQATTTNFFLRISSFIKKENPKPVGLCGLMFPCLEDAELADEYEQGNFSMERNVYLSLHSGLGVDTYPIGTNEKPSRVLEILKLIQGLSNKYKKPLSARFVSDGKARVGDKTNFKNQYLKDVIIRSL